MFAEHLLQLIGEVIRQCSGGLKVVHNHSKAYSSLAYTRERRNQGDVFRYVSMYKSDAEHLYSLKKYRANQCHFASVNSHFAIRKVSSKFS